MPRLTYLVCTSLNASAPCYLADGEWQGYAKQVCSSSCATPDLCRAFGDFWILHLSDAGQPLRWEEAVIPGTPPTARFDHCGFIFPVQPNSTTYDKFVIMGGRDNSSVFNDR